MEHPIGQITVDGVLVDVYLGDYPEDRPYPPIPAEVRKRVGARLRTSAERAARSGMVHIPEEMKQDADLIDPPSNPPVDDSVPEDLDEIEEFFDWRTVYDGGDDASVGDLREPGEFRHKVTSVPRSPKNGIPIYRLGDDSDEPAYMADAPGDDLGDTYAVYDPMLGEPQEEPLVNPITNPDDDAPTENDWEDMPGVIRNPRPTVTGTHAPLDLTDDDIDTVVKALVALAGRMATEDELSTVKALTYILDHGGSDRDPVLDWEPIDRGDGSEVPVDGQYVIRLATEARMVERQLVEHRSKSRVAASHLAKAAGRLRQRR